MNIGIIIQARSGSTRFPAKILQPFWNDLTVLEFLINRLQKSKYNYPIIIATTELSNDDTIATYAKKDILLYRGSEYDVLDRFIKAADKYALDTVIRICSDNPLIDILLMDNLLYDMIHNPDKDYYSYYFNNNPVILSHFGIFCEIVSLKALKKVFNNYGQEYKEHVTNAIYRHEHDFNIYKKDITQLLLPYENIRLTIDTREDLENIQSILPNIVPIDTQQSIFPLINQNKNILQKMKKIIREQKK
jgi:spore coat polysaccharide biosynthesis protein SpsF